MDWRSRGVGLRVGGHRGASANAPENTYAAFEQAAAQGAVYTETDIRQTADGGLVLLHDATLDRTSDGRGPVSSMTLAGVRALDAGRWYGEEFNGQRIPELPAFLSWIEARPGFGAALEIKAPGLGGTVAQLAWASPARDRLAIYAFDPAEIRAAKAAVPGLPCVLLLYLDADPGGVLATIDACGAEGADVPWQWNATSLLGEMRERGLLIGGGSAHGGEAAERLIALGADVIDTDAPAAMLEVVRALTVRASGN